MLWAALMPHLPLYVFLGFSIGLSLGLLGGGGSILTVPALVYLVGQTPQAAVTTSLAIVAANSTMGALFHQRRGSLNWKVALLFGGAGMTVAYLSAGLSRWFSPAALLVMFAVLMVLIGVLMLKRKEQPAATHQAVQLNWRAAVLGGAGVGLLTGILGVGGGFLVVPALVMLVGLTMVEAIGTSLIIIAANSLAGLAGHIQHASLDLHLILVFIAAGLLGAFTGARLTRHLAPARLRQAFAWFVILLAGFLLWDNLPKLLL